MVYVVRLGLGLLLVLLHDPRDGGDVLAPGFLDLRLLALGLFVVAYELLIPLEDVLDLGSTKR